MLLPVLLAGGSGTRLWPLSRELYPKQLLKLVDDRSLLQNTALRAKKIPGALPPVVICGERHRFLVAEQLAECGVEGATVILEPEGRNTAPAAAVAALFARQQHGAETQVFLMAADHLMQDERAFVRAAVAASKTAAAGYLMTFGIKPTRAETGYGYLKAGAPLGKGPARIVQAFVEKPDARRAARFIRSKDYFWNGGLFLFGAQTLLDELARFEPKLLAACDQALARGQRDLTFVRLDRECFARARKESIDYAVMEKTGRIALVPLDAGWDDVGAWSFLGNLPADRRGNVVRGDTWLADTEDSLIHAESRLVAAVGLRNHIVVETRDAVLVAARDRAQDVKQIVAALKQSKRPEAEDHPKVYRPWGWYETLTSAPQFQVKRIAVKPGHKLSLQLHHRRAEHWIVVRGTARVTCGDRTFDLASNQSTFIPLGARHRLENAGSELLEIVEVQSGDYFGEDDIVRFEDSYGRVKG
ncbi:MAG TPA: mannose-1-phosphate guanylyltransferase/mannose-6-phosphate isomerase [Candidatus Binatia bacterium]|nr:mannose-1-phosphate guanylyltransferase/mannose-6-phosphate isomerase [Candidatus Binatia bacterium]